MPQQTSFRLELSKGQSWTILAEPPVQAWAERLADILELQEGKIDDSSRLIFRKRTDEESAMPGNWESLHLESITLRSCTAAADVICEVPSEHPDLMGIWESVYPIYNRAQRDGGLPVHAALVEKDGRGVLLAGVSSSGKSTCCRRIPPSWNVLCDEETLVLFDPEQNAYLAHPFPTWSRFAGQKKSVSCNVKRTVPLRALFFLEKSATDSILPLGRGRTAMSLLSLASEKCHIDWNRIGRQQRISLRGTLFGNACTMADSLPGFLLRVSRSGRFWEKMGEVLQP